LKSVIAFAVALLLTASVCHAQAQGPQKAPLFSKSRASLATGLNYRWNTTPLSGASEPILGRHAEWEAGVFGAYTVTPHASLVAATTLGLNSRQFRHTLGVRIRIWTGK
jgi:hypothetical protein